MTDLASFYTIQNSNTITGAAGAKNDAQQQGGFGIFDLFLAQIEQQIANGDGDGANGDAAINGNNKALDVTALTSDATSIDDEQKLNLVRILASNDTVADDVDALDDILDLDLLAEIEQTLALNQKIFDDAIKAGTGNDDLMIDKETGEIIVPDVAKTLNLLETPSDDINEILANIDLSTLNLTPQQMTLVQEIQQGVVPTEAQANDIQDIINTVLSGAVAIVPPVNAGNVALNNKGAEQPGDVAIVPPVNAGNVALNNKGAEQPGDVASRLNALTPGGAGDEAALEADAEFDQALLATKGKKYAGNPDGADLAQNSQNGGNTAHNNAAGPQFNILQAWPFAATGSLLGPSSFSDQVAEQLGLSLNGGQSTAQGSLTALVNQAQSASTPHPATQMVAATINKAGVNGQDTNISLRLDPPNLGRVDVNMQFGKDKTVKAVVTIEKPETFMMLQRDAQVLERALQDAGLDSDGGLSFELAQDGEFMDQQNQRGGGHDSGGTGGGTGADEEFEFIESTMTWRVDPETGHTRYNILA